MKDDCRMLHYYDIGFRTLFIPWRVSPRYRFSIRRKTYVFRQEDCHFQKAAARISKAVGTAQITVVLAAPLEAVAVMPATSVFWTTKKSK